MIIWLRIIVLTGCLFVLADWPARAAEAPPPSRKKGIGLILGPTNGWPEKLRALNCRWFYSWWFETPVETPADVEFVPMLWGPGPRTTAAYRQLTAAQRDGRHQVLLGYNEPDVLEEANLSVEKALQGWPKLLGTGLRLGSPGVAHPERQWLENFMREAEVRKYRVDFIAVHSYGGDDVQAFLEGLERIHKKFQRPLWITELGVADWDARKVSRGCYTPAEVQKFMAAAIPALEKLDYVERYAWFPAAQKDRLLGASALFDETGNLTELGRLYSTF
ncbi:MAG: glycosyl hydrolase [Verrucomicrobiota bacterium]|jgi:Glycosyl hydrolase catalytic core